MKNISGENATVARDRHRRHEIEETLRDELKKITDLSADICLSGEMERLNLASELRDNIGQTLVLARIKIGMLSGNLEPGEYENVLEDLRHILDRAVWETRTLSQRLCPPLLFEDSLEIALQWLAHDMEDNHGVRVEFHDDGSEKPLTDVLRLVIFQTVQYVLMNVARHARSGAAWLTVGREEDMLSLVIEDRGIGFDAVIIDTYRARSSGLAVIRRRIRNLGGDMTIRSSPGRGTIVTLRAALALS